ncbi:hypothetical protein NITLEN_80162 [Nitrospira lenta]|uniref:Uncharacterized protein n=1 Tax=Nitrospira lenta TaxID=1436998 RepID=A0A330LBP8_9BACT|nr:hypothetical protein NITLEN_80162 [Nitrospira lenta]
MPPFEVSVKSGLAQESFLIARLHEHTISTIPDICPPPTTPQCVHDLRIDSHTPGT